MFNPRNVLLTEWTICREVLRISEYGTAGVFFRIGTDENMEVIIDGFQQGRITIPMPIADLRLSLDDFEAKHLRKLPKEHPNLPEGREAWLRRVGTGNKTCVACSLDE
jgi:hypothetical protein